jgi:hypothetical protein
MEFAHATKVNQQAEAKAKARTTRAKAGFDLARSDADRAVARQELIAADEAVVAAGLETLLSMYAYMQSCLPDADSWDRFRKVATRDGVDAEELMGVCSAIFAAVTGRPSSRPSESSDGPSSIGLRSTDSFGLPVPTDGPPRPPTGSEPAWEPAAEQLRVLTAAERQRAELRGHMRPVRDLLTGS